MGSWLALAGFAIVAVTAARWFRLMRQVAIPQNKAGFVRAFGLGAALSGLGLLLGAGGLLALGGWIGLLLGGTICALQLQAAQDRRTPAVAVGQPMLAFRAPDDQGATFDSASLAGKPYLLKFFRGHW